MKILFYDRKPIAFTVVFEREDDGRWIAEVPELAGVMAYGRTKHEAKRRAESIALRTLADRLENGDRFSPALLAA